MGVFTQGVSGLNASQRTLEVISNNISNAGTVGFKSSNTEFADVIASKAGNGKQAGTGVQVAKIAVNFTQGNVINTGNPLDMSISGEGFFKVNAIDGSQVYTRNGQFSTDNEGFLTNNRGERVIGFPYDNVANKVGDLQGPIQFPAGQLQPRPTSTSQIQVNVDARSDNISYVDGAGTPIPFDPTDPQTYTSSVSQAVYDKLGNAHNLQVYFIKRDNTDAVNNPGGDDWEIRSTINGFPVNVGVKPDVYDPATQTFGNFQPLNFDSTGQLELVPPQTINERFGQYVFDIANADPSLAEAFDAPVEVSLANTTQFAAGFGIQTLEQNGYESSDFAGFNINEESIIVLRYNNGQTRELAKVGVFNFKNLDGLRPVGNNGYVATLEAGGEVANIGQVGAFGVVSNNSIEESNVDLTNELVGMLTAQRVYQANSQSIKTQDSLLQTITNLR